MMAWALGWALGKTANGIVKALTPSELSSRLQATIGDWARSLPEDCAVDPEAIFRRNDPQSGKALRLLSSRLTDGRIPAPDEWHDALLERWKSLAGPGDDLQLFFRLPEGDASRHLYDLAERLTTVCSGDEQMYRTAVAGLSERIKGWQDFEGLAARKRVLGDHVVLLVNELIEPPNYSEAYEIGFHVHNPSSAEMIIGQLAVEVLEVKSVDRHRIKTPGAPVVEHRFDVFLSPRKDKFHMNPKNVRFTLKKDESELFRAFVEAESGFEYLVRFIATETRLRDNRAEVVSTPSLWLTFERT
jgi:hypothetical protein